MDFSIIVLTTFIKSVYFTIRCPDIVVQLRQSDGLRLGAGSESDGDPLVNICCLLLNAMKQHPLFLSLPLSLSLTFCVCVRQEVRQNESSCLCLFRPQCVFKGFNRTHCCITVIIFLYCVYVRLCRPEMFAKARMFFQWRLQHEHTSSVWLC